jgi:hypothetical protein
MTEFITRSCKAESRYEVIIKTDSEEHYKATEDFARRLIDHAKPKTNADRIRAMSDEELAETLVRYDGVYDVYRTDCEGVHYDWVAAVNEELEWLQQPAEGE